MKYVVFISFLAILSLFYLKRSKESKQQQQRIQVNINHDVIRWNNCTMTSCFDLQRCMTNYSHLTVFIEPLVVLEYKGEVVSPKPSKEFLEIRKALEAYAVDDEEKACLTVPGVDFLDLERFKEKKVVESYLKRRRMKNVLIFNFYGDHSSISSLTARSMMKKSLHRSQFDISLPELLPLEQRTRLNRPKSINILYVAINSSSPIRREPSFNDLKNIKIVKECSSDTSKLCDNSDNLIHKSLMELISESSFILLTDDTTRFGEMLSLSLNAGTVPIVLTKTFVLPFGGLIDCNRLALTPFDLLFVPTLLESLNDKDIQEMRSYGQEVFDKYFSSPAAVAVTTMTILERMILPVRRVDQMIDYKVMDPYLSAEESANLVFLSDKGEDTHRFNALCQVPQIGKAFFVWASRETPPVASSLNCPIEVEVYLNVPSWHSLQSFFIHLPSAAVLLAQQNACSTDSDVISKSFYVWKSSPHRIVEVSTKYINCQPLQFINRIYLMQSTGISLKAQERKEFEDIGNKFVGVPQLATCTRQDMRNSWTNGDGHSCVLI